MHDHDSEKFWNVTRTIVVLSWPCQMQIMTLNDFWKDVQFIFIWALWLIHWKNLTFLRNLTKKKSLGLNSRRNGLSGLVIPGDEILKWHCVYRSRSIRSRSITDTLDYNCLLMIIFVEVRLNSEVIIWIVECLTVAVVRLIVNSSNLLDS